MHQALVELLLYLHHRKIIVVLAEGLVNLLCDIKPGPPGQSQVLLNLTEGLTAWLRS